MASEIAVTSEARDWIVDQIFNTARSHDEIKQDFINKFVAVTDSVTKRKAYENYFDAMVHKLVD
jgi:hypothetical protein